MPINYKLYPPTWKSHFVPLVLKRAQNCCEECGLKNGQIVQSYTVCKRRGRKLVYRQEWTEDIEWNEGGRKVKVVLTVAHLDNDSFNFNVKLDRLKALCQKCHLRMDANYKAQCRKSKRKTLRVTLSEAPNSEFETNLNLF
jgi:hypothetical protein